ncbi:MAG: AAA family ATPase [Candidatus Micrarchaeales archaeon]
MTGTPGTGKTYLAKRIASSIKNSSIIELNDLVGRHKLFTKKDKFGTKIVQLGRLNTVLASELKKNKSKVIVIVGHLAPELRYKSNIAIVTRSGLEKLSRRLKERKYPDEKSAENLASEALDYCGLKMLENCRETYEVETDSDKNRILSYLKLLSSGKKTKKPKRKSINKFSDLLKLVKNGNRYRL